MKDFDKSVRRIRERKKKNGFTVNNYRPKGLPEGVRVVAYQTTVKRKKRKKGKREKKWLFFVTNINKTPKRLYEVYRKRWGIETGYRQVNSVRRVTNSVQFSVRVFLTGVSFLLLASWVYFNWKIALKKEREKAKRKSTKNCIAIKNYKTTLTLPQMRLILTMGR